MNRAKILRIEIEMNKTTNKAFRLLSFASVAKAIIALSITASSLTYATTANAVAEQDDDFDVYLNLHELMSESTFFVAGPSKEFKDRATCGTVFVLQKPRVGEDLTKAGFKYDMVLITAAHVFEEMEGDFLTIFGRTRNKEGRWERKIGRFRIRENKKNFYVKHPKADVAAMWMEEGFVPPQTPLFEIPTPIPTSLLGDDEAFKRLRLNVGSTLSCLGFPLCQPGSEEGFPILRSGNIATYPLYPLKEKMSFGFDFEIYKGNSGGPVYYFAPGDKSAPGIITMRKPASRMIAGLVSAQRIPDSVEGQGSDGKPIIAKTPLKLGIVISSPIILETIEQLPLKINK